MNRPYTIAFALLASLPAIAQAQFSSKEQLLELHAKSSKRPPASPSLGWDLLDWEAYSQAGWRAINKGYYDTAEHEFLSAIKAAKRPGFNDTELMARSYADYAWALQKQGRNVEAEPSAKWALIAREALLEPTSPAIAQNLNQLATLYYDLSRYAEAEPLLRRAIETQSKTPKANPIEYARSLTLMGLLLSVQRRFAEAEPHFGKAITVREKAQGPSHPDTADALSNLAWTYLEQGKDDKAQPLFERSLKIVERLKGESDYSVAHIAYGLARILANQDKFAEAETYYLRTIAIWERYPNEGTSLLQVLRHYSNLLEEKGRSADLSKVKSRIAPLRAKYTLAMTGLGPWYRFPEPAQGPAKPVTGQLPG